MNFGRSPRAKGKRRTPDSESPSVTPPSFTDFSIPESIRSESPSPPDETWEAVPLSSTEYATRRRELMQLISDLRSLGGETVLDLPSIVVIGGQSAGKSSLVEAVTGVNVPRDSGTCTRCPMECTMSSNATTWSCRIKLRFDYDSFGSQAVQQKEMDFGPVITDQSDMDIWLRRAQAAILNPNLLPEIFHNKSAQDLKDFTHILKFSRNVVSIFIEDPTATDLSFVDLPGLIQNEEQEVLDLVRDLTESYISRNNTIILTTIPMSDDMQNQQSVRLAREADPLGERTIGILTKPDMLGEGAVHAKRFWTDVIKGRQHRLKHGYYCVRLPDDAERAQRLSRSAFEHIASEYFETTSPWSGMANRERFGIPAFVSDISVLLVNHINKVIPKLKADVDRLLTNCLRDIGTLPKPLEADPQIEVLVRVNTFCDAFKSIVSGTSPDKTLAQQNRELYAAFSRNIRRTSPDFRPFEQPMEYRRLDPLESDLVMSLVEEPAVPVPAPVLDTPPPPTQAPNGVKSNKEGKKGRATGSRVPTKPVELYSSPDTMGLYDVRRTIKDSIAWELPGNIPYEAKTRLINQFTTLWSNPAERCLMSINDVLDGVVEDLVETHFGRFKVLQDFISNLIRPDIEEHKQKALTAVRETLELEIAPNYTQNEEDYNKLRADWLAKYKLARREPGQYKIPSQGMCGQTTSSAQQNALNYLAQVGYPNLTVQDLTRLSSRDQFEDELVMMADVRAYFAVAYKRCIDHIPLKIEHSLHRALTQRLSVSLLQRLMADTTSSGNFADRMRELVSEDPAVQAKRVRLESSRARLQEMKTRLGGFVP